MGMQARYKSMAMSKGMAKFDDLYFVSKPKEKVVKPRRKKTTSKTKNGEFFIKI